MIFNPIGNSLDFLGLESFFTDSEVAEEKSEDSENIDSEISCQLLGDNPKSCGKHFSVIYDHAMCSESLKIPVEVTQTLIVSYLDPKSFVSAILTCREWKRILDQEFARNVFFDNYILCDESEDKGEVGKLRFEYSKVLQKQKEFNLYTATVAIQALFRFNFYYRNSYDNTRLFKALIGPKKYESTPNYLEIPIREINYSNRYDGRAFYFTDSVNPEDFGSGGHIFRSSKHDIVKGVDGISNNKFIGLQFTVRKTTICGKHYPKCFGVMYLWTFGDTPSLDHATNFYEENNRKISQIDPTPNGLLSRDFYRESKVSKSEFSGSDPDFILNFVSKLMSRPDVMLSFGIGSEAYERTFVLGLE